MNEMTDFDRRLGDWLEDGPQTIPDWLLDRSIEQAHATPQLGAGFRFPWIGRLRVIDPGRLVPLATGAVGALAVVAAFVLGLLSAPRVGDDKPTPSPTQSSSPGPSASVVPRAVGGLQAIDVLPGETPDFYALIGLAATGDAVWTVVVTEASARLVRIDAATAQVTPLTIPGAGSILSPPIADGDVVWTGSGAGLHRVNGGGASEPVSLPIGFVPLEIDVSGDGLWVAREGGVTLIDRTSGGVLREVAAPPGALTNRLIGAPAFDSLWACLDPFTVARLDPVGGNVTGTTDLPAESDCHGRVFALSGAPGMEDGMIPLLASVVIDPATSTVSSEFDVGPWSDVVVIDGRLLFLEILRDRPGLPLALVELDPVTRVPAQVLTFEGAYHLNTTFESGYLAVAGDFLWVLADPTTGGPADDGPQIIRIPLSELRQE